MKDSLIGNFTRQTGKSLKPSANKNSSKDPIITDQTKYFTETLISIANESKAKTSTSNKHNTSWFNDESRKAIRLRKAALRKFNKQPITTNLNNF